MRTIRVKFELRGGFDMEVEDATTDAQIEDQVIDAIDDNERLLAELINWEWKERRST